MTTQQEAPQLRQFIRLEAVLIALGLSSPESIWARLRPHHRLYDPLMPKPIKVGKRAVAWDAAEIAAYQQMLMEKREQQTKGA